MFVFDDYRAYINNFLFASQMHKRAHYVNYSLRRSKLNLCHRLQHKLKITIEMCHFNEINVHLPLLCPNAVNFFYIVGDPYVISI